MGTGIDRVMVILATSATLVVNGLANTAGINGRSTGAVANQYDLPFTPAGYVFSIWGLIYLALVAFSAWQFSASGARSVRAAAIRSIYVFSAAANMAWLWFWHHEALAAAMVVMLLLLASLAVIYRQLSGSPPASRLEAWCLDVPFRLYLAWITMAALANLSVVVAEATGLPVSVDPVIWSQGMLAAALVIGALVFARLRDPIYLCVISWAAVGIALKGGQAPAVSVPAMIVAGLAGLGAVGLLLAPPRAGSDQSTMG